MNRIYQGRIVSVEEIEGAGRKAPMEGRLLENWGDMLWDHNALFQDAVNYYLTALLAMAAKEGNPLYKIRMQIAQEGDSQVWDDFRRRGVTRPGMWRSVGRHLAPGVEKPTPEYCYKKVLESNEASIDTLDAALRVLLKDCGGDGAIQKEGRAMLPRFCDPGYAGGFSNQTAAKKDAQKELAVFLHQPGTEQDLAAVLNRLKFEDFASPARNAAPKTGKAARKILNEAVEYLAKAQPSVLGEKQAGRYADLIEKLPDTTAIPAYQGGSLKKKLKDRFYAYLLFVNVEQSRTTFELLRKSFTPPKEDKGKGEKKKQKEETVILQGGEDPVSLARGARGYVFRAFTSLSAWKKDPADQTPACKEFDIAAFKEALKAINQINKKGKERDKERSKLQKRLDYMLGRVQAWTGGEEEEEEPPRLAGDPRIELLDRLVNSDLAAEYEMAEGEDTPYGLQERTIRGFREIRKQWRKTAGPGTAYSEARRQKLLETLREHQRENPERIGSVSLFEYLTRAEYWPVWQEPDTATLEMWRDRGFADDPLSALVARNEAVERIEKLGEPVRLTPADPEHSCRQYLFSDWKTACKHDENSQSVVVFCAARTKETGLYGMKTFRLKYSAPRLLRDGLKSADGTSGGGGLWLQPMMAALFPDLESPQDFSKAAVALMPVTGLNGKQAYYLNFPVTVDTKALAERMGVKAFANADFIQFNDKKSRLRWFAEEDENKPSWTSFKTFQCLGADLGQRDAAACAIIGVAAGKVPEKGRAIGVVDEKCWNATLKSLKLLRLPGEDAEVWRNGERATELSGERGRNATPEETAEALEICALLGQDSEILGTEAGRLSHPQMNDRLLVAMRRAQSRMARLNSWAWMITGGKKGQRDKAFAEIAKDERLSPEFRALAEKLDETRLKGLLSAEIDRMRPVLCAVLERIANRILPRRDAVWVWRARHDAVRCHVLATEKRPEKAGSVLIRGQRGLSMERIEQLEELRRRCQSLNRALMHTPGEKPVIGRKGRGTELPDPCPQVLEKLEAIREQRVNQTAHMIVAEALGVRLRRHCKDAGERMRRDIHGEYERIPGRAPVDMVVLEDLSRYLSSQDRPRRENSRLMKWCHRAVLGKVKELCEPYGIAVLETPAAWSSRFSSRSGMAGFRAVEVTPGSKDEFPWRNELNRLREAEFGAKKIDRAERGRLERIRALFDALDRANEGRAPGSPPRTLLAPMAGGPLFVDMNGAVMQADINAAINLALRAVASPRAHDIHPRIRTARDGNGVLRARRGNTLERWRWDAEHEVMPCGDQPAREPDAPKNPNYFADAAGVAGLGRAKINGVAAASGLGLWGTVKSRAWDVAGKINNDRLEKWGVEEIPF